MSIIRIRQEQDVTPRWQYERDYAESLGFTCKPDSHRGSGWCSFQKGDVHVWAGRHWCRARLIDNSYRHHAIHATLGQALRNEGGESYGPDSNPRRYSSCVSPTCESTSDYLKRMVAECSDADDFVLQTCGEGVLSSRSNARRYWADKRRKLT